MIGSADPSADDAAEKADTAADGAADTAEGAAEDAKQEVQFEGALEANDEGQIVDESQNVIATLPDDEKEKLGDSKIEGLDPEGNVLGEDQQVLAKADLAEGVLADAKEQKPQFEAPLEVKEGSLVDATGKTIATLSKEEAEKVGDQEVADINAQGELQDKEGNGTSCSLQWAHGPTVVHVVSFEVFRRPACQRLKSPYHTLPWTSEGLKRTS